MPTQVPDLLEPPRLTGDPTFDTQALVNYSWASYRALRVALDRVSALGTISTQDANNVSISGGTVSAQVPGAEVTSHKNAASGYAGLSATYQIEFKNNAGTVTNWLSTASTVGRTHTFQDADGTVAHTADINTAITGGSNAAVFLSLVLAGVRATNAAAPTIASAAVIAPTKEISFISGVVTIQTITPPAPIASGGGQITLIPTGLWATDATGNIALASTAVIDKALILTYDTVTAKWYPSY